MARQRQKHHFCVTFWVYGSIWRWRGYCYTKREAIKECMNAFGCTEADINEVYKEDEQW